MGQFLIIPDRKNIEASMSLAKQYGLGFEFDDFWSPGILSDTKLCSELIDFYKLHRSASVFNTLHGDFFDVLVFSEDPDIRKISEKRIIQSLEVGKQLGVKAVIFHTNYAPQLTASFYRDNWLKKNTDFWSRICPLYPDINILLENMFDESPDMLAALAGKLSGHHNFGICFDYAHAHAFGDKSIPIERWCQAFSPYTKHLHINDNDLKNDLHLAIGDGLIDWELFIDNYNKYFNGCSILIETADIEKQKKSLKKLKV